MLYSCTRHLSLTLPLSTQVGYRRMQCLGVTLRWVSIPRGEWISCSNIGQLAQERLYRTQITFLCTFMWLFLFLLLLGHFPWLRNRHEVLQLDFTRVNSWEICTSQLNGITIQFLLEMSEKIGHASCEKNDTDHKRTILWYKIKFSYYIKCYISNVRTKKENFYVKNTSCSGNEGILGTASTTDMCKTIYLKKADC